jgi:DNA-binding response OmpR family regulator
MANKKLLVIENDARTIDLMTYHLSREGYSVQYLDDQEVYIQRIVDEEPSLIIFDMSKENLKGFEFCQKLKKDPRTRGIPQVIVSDSSEEDDVVRGLELGVDDYLRKPLRIKELVARVGAILRRGGPRVSEANGNVLEHPGLEIDADAHRVRVGGEIVPFTAMEFGILRLLASNPGRVFSRDEILRGAFHNRNNLPQRNMASNRNVDVHIKAIREKLGELRKYIVTVRGVGYQFKLPAVSDD